MFNLPRNRGGETIPILSLDTLNYRIVNGTSGAAKTSLEPGSWRMVILESTGNNAFIDIRESGAQAVANQGAYMPLGVVEYIFIEKNSEISVIDGILNIVKAY